MNPVIKQTVEMEVPEHQILLSFINDDDVPKFLQWWEMRGRDDWEDKKGSL